MKKTQSPTKATKKQQKSVVKQKLKTLEWTDESIEEYSNNTSLTSSNLKIDKIENVSAVSPFVDDMESKIARVQLRRQEAEGRLNRRKLQGSKSIFDNYLSRTILSGSMSRALSVESLVDLLNSFFDDYLQLNSELITSVVGNFPLHFYDSSIFDEHLKLANSKLPSDGACLISSRVQSYSLRESGLGYWVPCSVNGINNGLVSVNLRDGSRLDVTQMQICLLEYSRDFRIDKYSERIVDALSRRRDCMALMKYYFFIHNMPYSETVTSSLLQSQADKIQTRAVNKKSLLSVNPAIGIEEMNQVRTEYEVVMNKMLFDANMLGKANLSVIFDLRLPIAAFPITPRPPYSALFFVPPHHMKNRITHFQNTSFLCSPSGLNALQGVVKENISVSNFTIANTILDKTYTLDRYETLLADQILYAVRIVRQDWPQHAGVAVRRAVEADIDESQLFKTKQQTHTYVHPPAPVIGIKYDVMIRTISDFEASANPIKLLLERINFMMGEVLTGIVRRSVTVFTEQVCQLCTSVVEVEDIRNVRVILSADSIYKKKVIPPLFTVSFRVTAEERILNAQQVEKNLQEIEVWKKSKEAANGDKCSIKKVEPKYGKTFEYGFSPEQFKKAVLNVFDGIVSQFMDVPHVQKFVMEKIYFPIPRSVPSIHPDSLFVQESRNKVSMAMDNATAPLVTYLTLFRKYEDFINLDIESYIKSKIAVTRKDPDSTEIELPVSVNLGVVSALIDQHVSQIQDIERNFPITPIDSGLFLIEVSSVRQLLLDKHNSIVRLALTSHAQFCSEIKVYLDEEFRKIMKNLSKRPETIEQLVELDEYVNGIGNTLQTLQGLITDMMSYHDILDKYRFKIDFEQGTFKWTIFGLPAKIATKCVEVLEGNVAVKRRFRDDMLAEQVTFVRTLNETESQVGELAALCDINDVVNIAAKVKEMENKLAVCQSKARLFNSREGLFEQDVTDYEDLNRIQKSFEPYGNLWQTAKDWMELSKKWMTSRFIDLDAEEVERNVDKYNIAINKAAKFFQKADMAEQSAIANLIKTQVGNFIPEVPLIVTLRNPGMRDRHWEKIASTLGVDILPIENFTTEQIIAMNLKDNLDLIQKIGESAAKEYQIETALNKMENEWKEVNLQIHPYKETGTGVIKGVDDISVILDEQITMTQVCFSKNILFHYNIYCLLCRQLCSVLLRVPLKLVLKNGIENCVVFLMCWKFGSLCKEIGYTCSQFSNLQILIDNFPPKGKSFRLWIRVGDKLFLLLKFTQRRSSFVTMTSYWKGSKNPKSC